MLLAARGAYGQNVTAMPAADSQPAAVAVNPVDNKIHVVNNGGASVTVIDAASNTINTTVVKSEVCPSSPGSGELHLKRSSVGGWAKRSLSNRSMLKAAR